MASAKNGRGGVAGESGDNNNPDFTHGNKGNHNTRHVTP
jgi:hypothetical protein